ncbi:MAG: universal stress protein [Aeromicrobium sp.]
MTDNPAITVGIDGGYASGAALELALREAFLRGAHVRAVACWTADPERDGSERLLCSSPEQADELLEIVTETARRRHLLGVRVERETVPGPAGPALVEASRAADLLVLGSADGGMSGSRHTGRTIGYCLRHATPPVVVVPWTFDPLGPTWR